MKSDQELQTDVRAALTVDTRVKGNEIGVIAKDGAVTLTGKVDTYADRLAAEQAAKRVSGIRAIAQTIEVKLPEEQRVTDEGIAERIARLPPWTHLLRDTNVLAEVRNGFVTLTGDVDHAYQKQTAEKCVGELDGVVGISNLIAIRERGPELKASDVVRQIMRALHHHPNITASNVRVSVTGAKVKLEGTIATDPERKLVADAVWAIPGVTEIEDHLLVG